MNFMNNEFGLVECIADDTIQLNRLSLFLSPIQTDWIFPKLLKLTMNPHPKCFKKRIMYSNCGLVETIT